MAEEVKFVADLEVGDTVAGFGKVVIKGAPTEDGSVQIVFLTQQAVGLNQEAQVLVETE